VDKTIEVQGETTQTETPDNLRSEMTPEELQQVAGGQNGAGSGPPH
jgi:hypothetical protein